jgi:hypothetical protein
MAEASEEAMLVRRLMHAVKGRPLSWSLARVVALITGNHYSGGDKLRSGDKPRVQELVDWHVSRGVVPAETLLTDCQQRTRRAQGKLSNG